MNFLIQSNIAYYINFSGLINIYVFLPIEWDK